MDRVSKLDRIGKYEVLDVLGQGGMGVVYRARDPVIGRQVAIKVILDRAMDAPAVRERFYREARSAGALSHENVMTIYDVGEDEGRPYIVMELLDGTDLRHVLARRPLPALDQRLDIALQVCHGLGYAHSRGVVHRDIKPENVQVTTTGRVKLLDFGIARIQTEQTLTQAQIGTPRYMSPEQIKGESIDGRTDIFSFGVLLYELLGGSNPFHGDHITSVIYKVLHEDPPALTLPDSPAGRDLQRVVSRCLAKSPHRRYAKFAEVSDALRAVRSLGFQDEPEQPSPKAGLLGWFRRDTPTSSPPPIPAARTAPPPAERMPTPPPLPGGSADTGATIPAGPPPLDATVFLPREERDTLTPPPFRAPDASDAEETVPTADIPDDIDDDVIEGLVTSERTLPVEESLPEGAEDESAETQALTVEDPRTVDSTAAIVTTDEAEIRAAEAIDTEAGDTGTAPSAEAIPEPGVPVPYLGAVAGVALDESGEIHEVDETLAGAEGLADVAETVPLDEILDISPPAQEGAVAGFETLVNASETVAFDLEAVDDGSHVADLSDEGEALETDHVSGMVEFESEEADPGGVVATPPDVNAVEDVPGETALIEPAAEEEPGDSSATREEPGGVEGGILETEPDASTMPLMDADEPAQVSSGFRNEEAELVDVAETAASPADDEEESGASEVHSEHAGEVATQEAEGIAAVDTSASASGRPAGDHTEADDDEDVLDDVIRAGALTGATIVVASQDAGDEEAAAEVAEDVDAVSDEMPRADTDESTGSETLFVPPPLAFNADADASATMPLPPALVEPPDVVVPAEEGRPSGVDAAGPDETQELATAEEGETERPKGKRGPRARPGGVARDRRGAQTDDRPPEPATLGTAAAPEVATTEARADTGGAPPLLTRQPTRSTGTAVDAGTGTGWPALAAEERLRPRWMLYGGAAVVGLLAVVLAYAGLRPDDDDSPAEEVREARNVDPAPPEGLVALGAAARTEMEQMGQQRDSAEAAGVEESEQFIAAVALQTEAAGALERGGEADLQRAAEAAREATALFRTARLTTAQLRDRATQAERSASTAREAALPNRREAGATASFDRGETALAGARRALQREDFAEATRLFTDAERAYRASRATATRGTAADVERERVLASRARSRAMGSAADGAALASAERAYSGAARSARSRDYDAAVAGYQNATRLYSEAARTSRTPDTRPPPPDPEGGTPADVQDLVRRVDEARRTASPNSDSDAYRQGERARSAAAASVRSGNYANARRLYAGALSAFQEAGRRTPTPTTTQTTSVSPVPFIGQYAGELQRAFETENLGALRAFHPYFNRYAGLFDNADNINATVATAPADISGNRATVGVTLSLRYQVNGQPEAPPPVRLRWTLELRGSTWRLVDVASR